MANVKGLTLVLAPSASVNLLQSPSPDERQALRRVLATFPSIRHLHLHFHLHRYSVTRIEEILQW